MDQKEKATIEINIDKKQSSKSIEELDKQIKQLTISTNKLKEANDPKLYSNQISQLNTLKETRRQQINVIDGERAALESLKVSFIEGLNQAKAATTNNPIKKFAADGRAAFEALNKSVQNSAFAKSIGTLKNNLAGAGDSTFFNYISTGFQTAALAAQDYKLKLELQKAALIENAKAQGLVAAAQLENAAAQKAVNEELIINQTAQRDSISVVATATSVDEANTAALEHKALVQEEVTLQIRAQKIAEEESTIATEAQTIATEKQTLATATATTGLGVFRIAIASTGIGALVIAMVALVAYFTETNEGANKFKVIMAQLNAVLSQTIKTAAEAGKSINDSMDESKSSKLWNNIKAFFAMQVYNSLMLNGISKDTVEKMKDAAVKARIVTEARQQLIREERSWSTEIVTQQTQVGKLTKLMRDQNLTEKERIASGEKAKAIRFQMYKQDLDFAQRNLSLVEKEENLEPKRDLDRIQAAKTRVEQVKKAYVLEDQTIENRESGLKKKQLTKAQKEQTAYEAALQLALTFNAKDLASQQEKNDKEISSEENKYDAFIAAEKKYMAKAGSASKKAAIQAVIDKAGIDKQAAVNAIRERQEKELTDKIIAFNEALSVAKGNEFDKQRERTNKFYDDEIKKYTKKEDIDKLEAARTTALRQTDLNEAEAFERERERLEDTWLETKGNKDDIEVAKINKKYNGDLLALKKSHSDKFKETKEFKALIAELESNRGIDLKRVGQKKSLTPEEKAQQEKDFKIKMATEAADTIFKIGAENRQAALNAEIQGLEDSKNAELAKGNLTNAQKQAINDKYAKQEADAKLKAWEAQRMAAEEQAIIQGALAVVTALAQVGPLGAWVIPAIIATTAANVAVIASQKAPKFGDGGILPDGPLHNNGGIKLMDDSGQVHGEIEGGEPIISRAAYAANRGVVNALLNSGGRRIDMNKVTRAVNGNPIATAATPGRGNAAAASNNSSSDMAAMIDEMRLTREAIQNQKIEFNTRAHDEYLAKVAFITKAATV